MNTLILMRHAKSDWAQPGVSDHDRPLNARGRHAAFVMARHLADAGVDMDVILASSAERVRETIERMQAAWSSPVEVLTSRALYLAPPGDILAELKTLDDAWRSVMVVAHNPGLVALVSQLANQAVEMPTAAVAVFEIDVETWSSSFSAQQCRLTAFWKPRELHADSPPNSTFGS